MAEKTAFQDKVLQMIADVARPSVTVPDVPFHKVITDPTQKADAEFFLDHGMTRGQEADRERLYSRETFETGATADLQGEPPTELCGVRGLSPTRARYVRFFEWRLSEEKKLSDLQSRKAHLESLIDAPNATEIEIKKEIARASSLLAKGDAENYSSAKRKALDERLASEKYAAETARYALVELDCAIEIAGLRVAQLNSRETEFINPVVIEAAKEIGLDKLYKKKIGELRHVLELVIGLHNLVSGGSIHSAFESKIGFDPFHAAKEVRLPRFPYESGADNERALDCSGNEYVWQQLKQSLLLHPRQDLCRFIALPK